MGERLLCGSDALTDEGATLSAVDVVGADFHPAVEVDLRERVEMHAPVLVKEAYLPKH